MKGSKYLYDQIRMSILQMISSGQLQEGDKVPTEKELGELFEASRITVRRALKELEAEDVLEILHGKGTFVKRKKQSLHMLNLEGFTEGLQNGRNDITKVILEKRIINAPDALYPIFQRDDKFKVLKLVREIKHHEAIFSVDYAYFPVDIYPDFDQRVKDNVSTFEIVHKEYGIKFMKARKVVEVVYPDEEVSEWLGISKLDHVIQIKKVTYDEQNRPVHFSTYYVKADNVKLFIDIDIDEKKGNSSSVPEVLL
ncbi:GntR family transcriptional regulator [Fusibacter ferrireducens]|uniref:GntR family transcriptional regulator n=1 Tax=Fusibacter ferrireducens TaxID=2785058 RepID=A0ABR9ZMK6_9FIRM|nr:GntR family transcriptional regulator [Fusibacter ferrireducens]MBF4691551.1 GntR family transcriptional regulator [Fusibacter ferrireducens]